MKYPEYLSAAKRHNHACKVLKSNVSESNEDELKYITMSLYYLSGYIIECSLKYKIFELSGYDQKSEVNEEECTKLGINYKNKIKTHNFIKLQEYLSSLTGELSCMSEVEEIDNLLKKWRPDVRYEHIDLDCQEIIDFYNHTALFLRKI